MWSLLVEVATAAKVCTDHATVSVYNTPAGLCCTPGFKYVLFDQDFTFNMKPLVKYYVSGCTCYTVVLW